MFRRMKITDKLTVVLPISISFSCHRYQVSLVKNYLPPCHSTSPHTFVVHIFPVQCPMFPCDVAGFQARVSRVIFQSAHALARRAPSKDTAHWRRFPMFVGDQQNVPRLFGRRCKFEMHLLRTVSTNFAWWYWIRACTSLTKDEFRFLLFPPSRRLRFLSYFPESRPIPSRSPMPHLSYTYITSL